MSRTIRRSALAATTAALGLAIAIAVAIAIAPSSASASADGVGYQAQAGLAFQVWNLTGASVPLKENTTCAPLNNLGSGEVTDGKSTITFFANSNCAPVSELGVATPGNPAMFPLVGAEAYSSTS